MCHLEIKLIKQNLRCIKSIQNSKSSIIRINMIRFLFKYCFCCCLLFCGMTQAFAQNIDKQEEKEIVYSKEWITGVKLHTNGYGLFMTFGKILNRSNKRLFTIELQEIKHPRQIRRRIIDFASSPQSYYFGKQNTFINLNGSYLFEKVLAEKGRKNGVLVSWRYGGGLSLGLLKPYYLKINPSDGLFGNPIDTKYDPDEIGSRFLSESNIQGASSFFTGIGETKIIPGAVLQSSLIFDWANYNQWIKAVEVGVMSNIYYKRIPIMITEDNSFFYFNFYLKLLFGERKE